LIAGFVCKSSVERVERVVRSLVDAGLAQTEISIVYPRRSKSSFLRGEFSGSLSRRQDFGPELESLVREGLVLVRLERPRPGAPEGDAYKQLAKCDVESAVGREVTAEEVGEDVLLVVRCSDDSSRQRGSRVLAAAGGVWDEEGEGLGNRAAANSDGRNGDA
jgi:hypothetical protein